MTDTLSAAATSPIGWDATTPMGYAALLILIALATSWHMTFGGGQ
jgi:hypothetical protein